MYSNPYDESDPRHDAWQEGYEAGAADHEPNYFLHGVDE